MTFEQKLEEVVKNFKANTQAHCDRMKEEAEDYKKHSDMIVDMLKQTLTSLTK